jgi:hypothetical protein
MECGRLVRRDVFGPRSYLCDSRVESGRPTRGVYKGHCWTGRGLPSKNIARPPFTYGPVRMSKDDLTDVLVRRRQWMDAPWTSYLV